jgi:predicted aldo/keto reductase-like oxidoreductase
MNRRELLKLAMAATATPLLVGAARREEIPRRKLGRTGETVTIIGLGGFHVGKQKTEDESVSLIRAAIDGGITFLDNCWDYNDGQSEVRMGKALRDGYRQKVFLMTKIDGRDHASAARQIDESLRRLGTDRLDLLQMHEVIRPDDPERIFAKGGALEAVLAARQAGKVRFVGFTGHKSPAIHKHMIETADAHGFTWDTVQMPLNVMDAHRDSFEKVVLPLALARGMGIIGMKPMGDPFILDSKTVTPAECLQYTMSLPVSVCVTGIDSPAVLEQDLRVARGFAPLSEAKAKAILAKTAAAAASGEFEKYKHTHHFDGTVQHPEWLG